MRLLALPIIATQSFLPTTAYAGYVTRVVCKNRPVPGYYGMSQNYGCEPEVVWEPDAITEPKTQNITQGQFFFTNKCNRPISVAIHYRNLNGKWETRGWYNFSPNESAYLSTKGKGIVSNNPYYYFYPETTDSENPLVWEGDKTYQSLDGRRLGFIERRDNNGNKKFSVRCDR